MTGKAFRYAAIALKVLEKLLGSRFRVEGIENLKDQPTLFVANHFTRSETFFVPYIINKYTKRQVRCLADSSLYNGVLGRFLNSAGTISTKNPNRDKIILQDLIYGDYDWMIYPEGSMIKSKEIRRGEGFVNHTPSRVGRVRTGSAILALKSEIYRKELVEAHHAKNKKLLQEVKDNTGAKYKKLIEDKNTQIVPVNITYYPIRPGNNRIKSLLTKLVRDIPKQIAEELEIEGNLLMNAEINISFGESIDVGQYIKNKGNLIYQIPFVKRETKNNFVLKYFKHRLTVDFMKKVYLDVQINLDHLFVAVLYFTSKRKIHISHLKRMIYRSSVEIERARKYRFNASAIEDNLFKMFIDEDHEDFDSVFALAKKQGLIEVEGDMVKVVKSHFHDEYDFHKIRTQNTLVVVVNEFLLMRVASDIVQEVTQIADKELKQLVFDDMLIKDVELYESDYEKNFDVSWAKNKSLGFPQFIDSNNSGKKSKIGIVLCHGYKASPKEVEALGDFLNNLGFKVYLVRLAGHGTSPANMKYVTWQDWYESMHRGYAALNNICDHIIISGFSTGGLLTLLADAKKKRNLTAIIAINSALKLRDIKAKMVPGINIWNDLLEKLKIEKGKFEYVDDQPENPHINYSRNYLKGVEELGELMDECEDNLKKVKSPALIIQAKNDPVVNSKSGGIIYKKVKSKKKVLLEPDFDNHVIVNGEKKEEVFKAIKDFISELKL